MKRKADTPERINFVQRFKGKCELIPSSGLKNMVADKNAKGIDISAALVSLNMNSMRDVPGSSNFHLNNG